MTEKKMTIVRKKRYFTDDPPAASAFADLNTLETLLAKQPHPAILALAESLYEIGRIRVAAGLERDPANIERLARARTVLQRLGRAT